MLSFIVERHLFAQTTKTLLMTASVRQTAETLYINDPRHLSLRCGMYISAIPYFLAHTVAVGRK